MLRWTEAESWPMALKSFSAVQPPGRAGSGSVTGATEAIVFGDVVVDLTSVGCESRKKKTFGWVFV